MRRGPIARAARGGVTLLRAHPYLDVVVAALGLTALGVLVFGDHIRHAGFYSDDWSTAASVELLGYRETVTDNFQDVIPGRPILAAAQPVTHYVFGLDMARHHAFGVFLAACASLSFFVLLRGVRVERGHAFAMAGLSLVFPWSLALRLWPIGAIDNLAVIAYFLGAAAAVSALGLGEGRRGRALALHVVATILYVVSVLTYQIAPAVILGSVVLYRTRVSWRRAARRWFVDVAVVLVVTAASAARSSQVRRVGSLHDMVPDIPLFVRDGLALFAEAFLPRSLDSAWPKLLVLGAAAVVVTTSVVDARRGATVLGTWLVRTAVGAGAIALSYVMFLGSGLLPSYSGIDDRANALAAFGFVVAAYGLVVLTCLLITRGRRWWSATCVGAAALVLGGAWIGRVHDDMALFRAARDRQAEELSLLDDVVGRPPPGSTLLVFGFPVTVSPGIPVFSDPWDLEGAIRLRWNDASLAAFPIYGRGVRCNERGVEPLEFDQRPYLAPYDGAIFVDPRRRTWKRVPSRRACLAEVREFTPGPLVGSS